MSRMDRVIVGAAGATVVVLAGVAGALSYSHMAQLARLHGEVGWRMGTTTLAATSDSPTTKAAPVATTHDHRRLTARP